jgi:hypothetical protein
VDPGSPGPDLRPMTGGPRSPRPRDRRTRRGHAVASGVRRGLPNRGARPGYVSFVRRQHATESEGSNRGPYLAAVNH